MMEINNTGRTRLVQDLVGRHEVKPARVRHASKVRSRVLWQLLLQGRVNLLYQRQGCLHA